MIATDTKINSIKDESLKRKHVINILIVDDHPENLLSLACVLEHDDRNIIQASSGNEALKIALEKKIDLMLLDVQMPGMDGFEVARLLMENTHTRDISIIFVTALSKDEKYTMQGYEEGAVDYLYKPLDINLVKAKVNVFEKLQRQRIQLHESNERLLSVNKQLDEFVYIVSHDLKAPLRGLSSLCSFLDEELGKEIKVEVSDLLNMMKSRTGRMQTLIDGILHYSRMANNICEKEEVSVKDMIINIIDLIDPPKNIKFEFPDNLPILITEKTKLHEVFQNLISNAVKYNDKAEGVIRINYHSYPDHYNFIISDNGCGIKEEFFEKIFGIFQTLLSKDKQESTGIGLTIVKKIVEQQGGTIGIESEFGIGSNFKFSWYK